MKILRKSKTDIAKLTTFYMRLVFIGLFITGLISSQTGCYLHSDDQEDLAKDLQERYSLIQPAGITALESLDSDLNKLLEAQKTSAERVTSTSEVALVGMSWCSVIKEANSIKGNLTNKAEELAGKPEKAEMALKTIEAQIEKLNTALTKANKAVEELEGKKTLQVKLEETNALIESVVKAINETVTSQSDDPLEKKLKGSIDEIVKYLNSLKDKETKTEKTFSLLLESVRLGRDITALQIESFETQANYYERVVAIYTAEEKLFEQAGFEKIDEERVIDGKKVKVKVFKQKAKGQIENLKIEFLKHDGSCKEATEQNNNNQDEPEENYDNKKNGKLVVETIQELSDKARSQDQAQWTENEDKLRKLLVALGKLQTLQVTTASRLNDLDLRVSVENYRQARLLDAVYERQRMVLISTGLDGVVRYSEGGWRSEDVGRVISIISTVAQVVTAVKTN